MKLERALQVYGITAEQWRQKLAMGFETAERFLTDKYRGAQRELAHTFGTDGASDENPLKVERQKLLHQSKERMQRELHQLREQRAASGDDEEDSQNLADFILA